MERCKNATVTGTIHLPRPSEPGMITRIITSIDELNSMEQDWADLLARSIAHTPFQYLHYNQVWWSTLGGGEWSQGDPWIFAGYDRSNRLVGIAPLFLPYPDRGELRLIGSLEISDYLDFIMEAEHASEFVETLLFELFEKEPFGTRRLILDNLLEESPSIPLIEQSVSAKGWGFSQQRMEPAPLLMLPSSQEAYFEKLESKQRREFKRKMRRAAEYPARVSWRVENQPEDINSNMEIFLDLMGNDAAKRSFLTDAMKEHFRTLAVVGSEAGWLHLAFLEVSGEPVFGYLYFVAQNRAWVYNSAFNPDHLALSPGWVLMGYLIQWAIEAGLEGIDFMRGDEAYKYRLGGSDRFVCRLTIEP